MKITIYELLGMVKDGNAPKRIKSEGHYYNYNELEKDYYEGMGYDYEYLLANTSVEGLNDEVEILEETPNVQVEMTEKQYFKYLDEQHKYMEQVKNYKPKPSYLKIEEEKKIPEKIPEEIIVGKKQPTHRIKKIEKKINEIISYLDYLKSKGDE